MNEVCRGPDCEEIAFSWLGQEYCSSTCRWAAGQAVSEVEQELLAIDLALISAAEPAKLTGGVVSSPPVILGEHSCSLPAPITVDDVARLYDVPVEWLEPRAEPAPPSRRGWLRRALDRLVR